MCDSQALSSTIRAETDREITEATVDCAAVADRNECTGPSHLITGPTLKLPSGPRCAWFVGEDEEFCDVNIRWMLQLVTAPGAGTQDPVCTYLNTLGESECAYAQHLDTCRANANCTIQSWEGVSRALHGTCLTGVLF